MCLLIYVKRNDGRINQKLDKMKLVINRSERNWGKSDKSEYTWDSVKCFIYPKNKSINMEEKKS